MQSLQMNIRATSRQALRRAPAVVLSSRRPRPTARTITAQASPAPHFGPQSHVAPAAAPDSPRQQRSPSTMSRASAAPTASITSPSLLQPEEYPLQPVMDRMPRFEHDLFGTAGAAVEVAPRVMGAIGERLTAGATNIHKLFVNGFSNIKSSSFWSKVKPAIVTFDAAAPTSEATSLSTTTPIFDILEASGEALPSVQLHSAAPCTPAPAPAATTRSNTSTTTDDTEAVLPLEVPAAATGFLVPAPAAPPLKHATKAASDAEACATALRQLEANGRILYRMDQYVPHALAAMSQGRTLRLVVVRDRATLHRLAPAVCELAGMYGCVVVLGEEQGQQLMGGVLDMPAVYSGHVESNKWEVLSCPSELQLHLKVPGRVHVVYGDKVLDMRREANRQGYCMSKYGTWCAAADPSPSAPWWDVSHVDHHHEPLLRQRMGEWF